MKSLCNKPTYTKSSLLMFELTVRRMDPGIVYFVIAIARNHYDIFRRAPGVSKFIFRIIRWS